MIGGIRFCGCGRVPFRVFLCLFWHETSQRACARDFLRDQKKTMEGMVPVQRTEEGIQQKAINRGRGKATVRERQLINEDLVPADPEIGLANVRG